MKLIEAQGIVMEFVKKQRLETNVEIRLLDLVSEVGELSKEVLKGNDYGKEQFTITPKWEEEFGDVLFSLICIANSTGINIEDSLNIALEKYKNRVRSKGSIGSDVK